jgi:hypothetical protein
LKALQSLADYVGIDVFLTRARPRVEVPVGSQSEMLVVISAAGLQVPSSRQHAGIATDRIKKCGDTAPVGLGLSSYRDCLS